MNQQTGCTICDPLGQTQVSSLDVGRFINNAKEKEEGKKNAAEVFCDDLRRREIYTAH